VTTGSHPTPEALWQAAATEAAPALAPWGAAVIAARDPAVAGLVAVTLARVAAEGRRVALADLVGDLPAITALLPAGDDDPHGVADSFRYGVSLNRIARPVDAAGTLFVLPSGTEAVAHEEIYRNERWRRLAGGFAEVGAQLLVVASPEVPGFDDLVRYVGGLVRVGAQAPAAPSDVAAVWTIETPAPLARAVAQATRRARQEASRAPAERRSRSAALLALAAALGIAGWMGWPLVRAQLAPWLERAGLRRDVDAGQVAPVDAPVPAPSPPASPVAVPSASPDSIAPTAPGDSARAPDSSAVQVDGGVLAPPVPPPVPRNPTDSTQASRYAVYVLAANTAASAVPAVERAARDRAVPDGALRDLAVSPVTFGREGARWYRVTLGAFRSRTDADALLAQLRTAGVLGATSGSVITVPLAFELARDIPADAVPDSLGAWRRRGLRAYALRAPDGRATLYAGAFESPDQAILLGDSLRALGFSPPLAFRLGRSSP
jgi:hypothetical protein